MMEESSKFIARMVCVWLVTCNIPILPLSGGVRTHILAGPDTTPPPATA